MIGMEEIISSADKRGVIPISVGVILGYILVWAVHMGDVVMQNTAAIEKIKEKQKITNDGADKIHHTMDKRVLHLEWMLHIKPPKDDDQ